METLKRYRGGDQQQIVVKHVTVNADQAVVSTGNLTNVQDAGRVMSSPALLTVASEMPMQPLDKVIEPELVGVGVGARQVLACFNPRQN